MAEQVHPWIGTTCGNYILRTLLDQGGVGMVFIAEHQFLSDRVALKLLLEGADPTGDLGRRFFQEARATKAINHPNVVQIRDFGEDRGRHYLVMDLLEGMSLATALRRGAIPEAEVARIAGCVADGLAAAHHQGIIHRDLKPGNIFLCADGQVKLLDFGMAKLMSAASAAQTAAGMVVGTPQYMAPEQIIDRAAIGPCTDVYGLGAVMFKMLTGRLPFLCEGLGELIQAHLNETPPRPSQLAPVSQEMEALTLQCLAKSPAHRPSSMTEVSQRLARIAAAHRQRQPAPAPRMGFHDENATLVDAQAPQFLLEALRQAAPPAVMPSAVPVPASTPPPTRRITNPSMGQSAPRITPGPAPVAPRITPGPAPVVAPTATPISQPAAAAPRSGRGLLIALVLLGALVMLGGGAVAYLMLFQHRF